MDFQFDNALPVLRRTPTVLRALLLDLPAPWIGATEGPGTWSPFDVVGHLIHADRTNWMPRVEHMLRHGDAVSFPAFDRDAMFAASKGRSLGELLDTFGRVRTESLDRLAALDLTDADLARPGRRLPERPPMERSKHVVGSLGERHVLVVRAVLPRESNQAPEVRQASRGSTRGDDEVVA